MFTVAEMKAGKDMWPGRLGAWFVLSILLLLTRGFSWLTAGLIAGAVPPALGFRENFFMRACLLLLGIAAVLPFDSQSSALVIASGILVVLNGRSLLIRLSGLCSILLTALQGSVSGLTFILILSALAVFPNRRKWRFVSMTLGLALCLVLTGLPDARLHPELIAQERHIEDRLAWTYVPALHAGSPAVLFRTSVVDEGVLHLPVDAGGVRDDLPVGTILAGEQSITFGAGQDTLHVPFIAGDSIRVRISRPWASFEHTVIHFGHCWTSPEEGS